MKAPQKCGLLVLNHKSYGNFLMSNLINFSGFYAFFGVEN